MFTGVIEEVGRVAKIHTSGGRRYVTVNAPRIARQLQAGSNIAMCGMSLPVLAVTSDTFSIKLSEETWTSTALYRLTVGAPVNLELPLPVDERGRVGGHMVLGHVDGTGAFLGAEANPDSGDLLMFIEVPVDLEKYVVYKGSIAIEGVSLAVAELDGSRASIAVNLHTADTTNLARLMPGDPVNIEADIIAKYLEKWFRAGMFQDPAEMQFALSAD